MKSNLWSFWSFFLLVYNIHELTWKIILDAVRHNRIALFIIICEVHDFDRLVKKTSFLGHKTQ